MRAIAIPARTTNVVPEDAAVSRTGSTEQNAALCSVAERSLREQWESARPRLLVTLTNALNDTEGQSRDVVEIVDEMAQVSDLEAADRATLLAEYRQLRGARIEAARAAMSSDPPDLSALPGIARGLFADEDQLLQQIGGDAAREAWRSHQLEARTVVLAITATLTDQDWQTATGW